MNHDDLEDYVDNLAKLVGFDLKAGTWAEEPSRLQDAKPGLPIALSRLFLALRCGKVEDEAS